MLVIILVLQTVHSSAMTQITANLMEKTLQLTVSRVTVLALDGLTKKHFGHYAFLKIVSLRSIELAICQMNEKRPSHFQVKDIHEYFLSVPQLSAN